MHERLNLPQEALQDDESSSYVSEGLKSSEHRGLSIASELITATARGQIDAFERLYVLSAPYLNHIALHITRNPALAEDVTAAALSQAWQQSDRFDPRRGTGASWLQCIVRSRALDAVRGEKDWLLHPDPWSLRPPEEDYGSDPQWLLLQSEQVRQLRKAIEALRPEEKQLLSLAFYKELTHEEISRKLELPLGTVKSHIRRGIEHLREALYAPAGRKRCRDGVGTRISSPRLREKFHAQKRARVAAHPPCADPACGQPLDVCVCGCAARNPGSRTEASQRENDRHSGRTRVEKSDSFLPYLW